MTLPAYPQEVGSVSISVVEGESLYKQLEEQLAETGARSWVGLTWRDADGLRNRVVDDAMMQGWLEGHAPASRMIVIDKVDDETVVDREILARGKVPIYFDTFGRELQRTISLAGAEFSWEPGRP